MTNLSAKKPRANRRSLRRCIFAVATAFSALGWVSEASAQGWLADRRYTEGPGIRTGDLELHPGIGGEVGYDSNWFLRSSEEGPNIVNGAPSLPPRDAAVFRVTPSFSVSTLGTQRLTGGGEQGARAQRFLAFRAGVSATARFFIGKEMENQHNVALNGDARLDLNLGQPIGGAVYTNYQRIVQPQVQSDPNLAFTRNDFLLGGEVIFLPGGGTFDLRTGYSLNASLYENTYGAPYSSLTHNVFVRDRWKFRPRTAVFSEATLSFLNYPNAPRAVFNLNDATPLRTRIGLTGLVTNWFGLVASAGYGATFFRNGTRGSTSQYDSITAQIDGTFYFGGGGQDLPGEATLLLSSVTFGVARDFQRSLLGNFYTSNRAYAKLLYWFGGRVLADFHLTAEQLNYPTVIYNSAGVNPTPEFTNYRFLGGIFAEYRFSQSLGVNTTIDFVQQISDTQLPAGSAVPGGPPGVFDMNYRRLQAFLGFRYFF